MHRLPCRVELGRIVVEQATRGLRVGEHGGERLVQLVRQAGRELAQCVQALDSSQAQQCLGPVAVTPTTQPGGERGQRQCRERPPGEHREPRPVDRSGGAAQLKLQRLARRRERLGEDEARRQPRRLGGGRQPGLQHDGAVAMDERRPHRTHTLERPFIPRHHAHDVDEQRVARRLGMQHERIAAGHGIDRAEGRATCFARAGLGIVEGGIGPASAPVAPQHGKQLRMHLD